MNSTRRIVGSGFKRNVKPSLRDRVGLRDQGNHLIASVGRKFPAGNAVGSRVKRHLRIYEQVEVLDADSDYGAMCLSQ